jgi:undecaprenyl-diphosphatase
MIETWQAVCLALIQGLTEFLPISSSAHLILPTLLLGWPDQGVAFDIAVHFGTLLAVLVYFRADLLTLGRGALAGVATRRANAELREVGYLVLATLPAIAVGFLLREHMDSLRTIPVVATTTIGFGLLLGVADRCVRETSAPAVPNWHTALLIGCAQAIAPVPGTSRSGITITAGLLLGLSRSAAARFSFLMSIPVILGAALLQLKTLLEEPVDVAWTGTALATAVAAISAYSCIAVFLRLIERIGMMPFVAYRLLLGAILVVLWWR